MAGPARGRRGGHCGESPATVTPTLLQGPCPCLDLDVADGIQGIGQDRSRSESRYAWILVRIFTEPVGTVIVDVPRDGLRAEQVAAAISASLGDVLSARASECGAQWPGDSPEEPLSPSSEPAFITSRREVLRTAPAVTAVICTREHPEGLEACLGSLLSQRYPRYCVLVVDNAPESAATSEVVARYSGAPVKVEYVLEPRPGLAWARNRALEAVSSGIAAWIDDDEIADRDWLAEVARGFANYPAAVAVSGIMLPAELRTQSQVWFEQYGGHHKHRGFHPLTFSPETRGSQSPLYPLPPFGTGGNMALRVEAVRKFGGFVTALGAGTWSLGGEDTRFFSEILLRGETVVYQPTAITHHFHRRAKQDLRRQMYGYGVGLTAFYSDLVASRPSVVLGLLRLVPRALRDAHGVSSLRTGNLPKNFPSDLLWSNRWGMLVGPWRYCAARVLARWRAGHLPVRAGAQSSGGERDATVGGRNGPILRT